MAGKFAAARKSLSVCAATFGAGVAWGMLPAFAARYFTSISEVDALLFIALPTAILVAAWLWPRAPKILGFERDDSV